MLEFEWDVRLKPLLDGAGAVQLDPATGARDYYYDYMQSGDRATIIHTLISHTTVKHASLYSQLGLPSYDPNCSTDPSPSWSTFQDFYVRRGIEERKVDVANYVELSFVNHALELLGRAVS